MGVNFISFTLIRRVMVGVGENNQWNNGFLLCGFLFSLVFFKGHFIWGCL